MRALNLLGYLSIFLASCCHQKVQAQNLAIVTYNADFENCEVEYDSLYRIPSNEQNMAPKYLLNDMPFTGCAKTNLNTETEQSNEYLISYIEAGYPVKDLYYYNNGDLSREFNFKNGKSHGKHLMYYEDGSKYIEEFFKEGKAEGPQQRWYKYGKIWRNALYSNGIKVFDMQYDNNGKEKKISVN